jgi:pimeloyl-ACP methyl ester carboxylesterase
LSKSSLFFEPSVSSRALGQESQARINRRELDRDPLTILSAIEAQLAAIIRWAKSDSKIPDMADAIKQPVLIINGNHDIVVPTVNSYHMFHAFSNARLILFPDSGHGSIFQFPGLFLEAAIPFLNNN